MRSHLFLHSFQYIRARFGSFTLVSIYSHSSTQIPTSTRGGGGRYHEGVPIPLIVTIEDATVDGHRQCDLEASVMT